MNVYRGIARCFGFYPSERNVAREEEPEMVPIPADEGEYSSSVTTARSEGGEGFEPGESLHAPHVYYTAEGFAIAICPFIDEMNRTAGWETNSSRGRHITFARVIYLPNKEDPKEIVFKLSRGEGEIRLLYLTQQVFDEKIRRWVAAGNTLNFQSDEDVQGYYKKTSFY